MSGRLADLLLDAKGALDRARALAAGGVPIFTAYPDPDSATGFRLPAAWQTTAANPRYVDAWQPGMALCAVMGHGLDLVDIDARNDADMDWIGASLPHVYHTAMTPSDGGVHAFIKSLGVRSRDNIARGIDIKAGADGVGRGFAFIAPTVRASKVDGTARPYLWIRQDDEELEENRRRYPDDRSGEALAQLVRNSHAGYAPTRAPSPAGAWDDVHATLAEGRHRGVHRLASALRGQGGWTLEGAVDHMYANVWPLIDQERGGHVYSRREFEADITDVFQRYEDGGGRSVDPERYFHPKNGLLVQTLADDILALGPLALGRDQIHWSYKDGVWTPDRGAVRTRVSLLMGQRARAAHSTNVRDVILSRVPELTCDPVSEVINFRNGLYHWRDDVVRAWRPEVQSTVQLSVEYDRGATCPAFDRFLSEVVPPDMIDLMWELVGYLMYSGNPLHKAVMLTGTGRNGKGTFLRVMTALLGARNITTVSLHDLVSNRFTKAHLVGRIANIAGDIDASYIENSATFKAITGEDMIYAEHKNQDGFDFRPWAVPVFSANKVPPSADVTVGYLSRWLVVPFPNDFSGREDRGLEARLATDEELRGIAAKAMEPLRRLLDRGDFELPESGRQATEDFTRRVDQVRAWLDECCDLDPLMHPFTPRTPLYDRYRDWAMGTGHRPVRASEFYDRIETAGASPHKRDGIRGYEGIRVDGC